MRPVIGAALAVTLCLLGAGESWAACDDNRAGVGGYALWMRVAGGGPVTVVFESGGGDDSSAWQGVEPAIRELGVRTVVYDRAGLGQSEPAPGPYTIDQEADALGAALTACGVDGPIVLAAHSYGGFIAALFANANPRVVGVVLIDANLGEYFDDAAAARVVARYAPQFDGLRAAAPALARVLIPVIEAYPDTARSVRAAPFAPTLPVIDIVAEQSWGETPEDNQAMRRAHASFAAASSAREAVFAEGSGHNVMRDRPEIVIAAITRMIRRVRGV